MISETWSPSCTLFGGGGCGCGVRRRVRFCAQLTGESYYSTSWYMYSVLKKVREYRSPLYLSTGIQFKKLFLSIVFAILKKSYFWNIQPVHLGFVCAFPPRSGTKSDSLHTYVFSSTASRGGPMYKYMKYPVRFAYLFQTLKPYLGHFLDEYLSPAAK